LGGGVWSKPVDGPVARPFDPPVSRFGPGHLGVDFATPPASPVHAAGDGVVAFAGRVGADLHVVVRHPGDIRTSYSFLASVTVVTGQAVERGAVVGTSGGTAPAHGAGVLHFGVRVGTTYIDPMRLFGPVDLGAVVHLAAPHGGPAGPSAPQGAGSRSVGERAALVEALRVDARPAIHPPAWWGEMRGDWRGGVRAESPPRPASRRSPATTSRSATTHLPGAGAAAVAAGISLGGVVVARRRRRRGRRLHSRPAR
jgi:murein DD-endopeptidase MepM/ murein hydrolase activator NlpD